VLKFLQRREKAPPSPKGEGPAGETLYAIGDIHGCRGELEQLLNRITDEISSSNATAHLIFLGDYVDRGPDSAGVLNRLIDGPLPGSRQTFLMGNHEEAMLAALDGDLESLPGWLRYGGAETLESYGIGRADILRAGADLPRMMREAVSEAHLEFLRGCHDYAQAGDYLFVHAGIRPGVPLSKQDPSDLRWIRDGFLEDEHTDHGVLVVHGHTIAEEPQLRSNRIGVDTGCYRSGRLTALVVEGSHRRFLSTR
jgi:serine/threonine protein phosphatase 1